MIKNTAKILNVHKMSTEFCLQIIIMGDVKIYEEIHK